MDIRVTCGTVGSGTDEDPYQAYVMSLWSHCSGFDGRDDPTSGVGPWLVRLVRPGGMSIEEYDAAMADILANPSIARAY